MTNQIKEIRKKNTLSLLRKTRRSIQKQQNKKSLIDFDEEHVSSMKSLAIKKETKVNLTTLFLSGKVLMFSKTSIQSFVCHLINVFTFPANVVKEIYKKNEIQKCFLCQNLTVTDSTSLFIFLFVNFL